MTNPINKQTPEQFYLRVREKLGGNVELSGFKGVDYDVTLTCKHGTRICKGWQVLKLSHCCRQGYYESGKMWRSNTLTLSQAIGRLHNDRDNVDTSSATLDTTGKYKKLSNIRCTIHDVLYSTNVSQTKLGICPKCNKENQKRRIEKIAPIAWKKTLDGVFVSRPEKEWLDELNVPIRQKWLSEAKCKVDGYDPNTNTVYLYHGGFWHGDLTKYDSDEIHPYLGITMKELYDQTLEYEQRIRDAGYKLEVKWG